MMLCICMFALDELNAQSIRLSESNRVKKVDISLAPGINKKGDKILQVSFIKFKKLHKHINTHEMIFHTASGKRIVLINPVTDTSHQSSGHSKSWYATFILTPEQIELLKKENLTDIVYYEGDMERSKKVDPSRAIEIAGLFSKYF